MAVLTFEHNGRRFEADEGSAVHEALVAGSALLVSRELGGDDAGEFGDLTVKELREIAAERGLDVPQGARKAELVALLEDPQPLDAGEDDDVDGDEEGDELE